MARLALVEKGVVFERRQIDIMETHEQFEAWYVALNPRAVVPTLAIGDEIVTDTIRIVNRVDEFEGPPLRRGASTERWLKAIMALHYGVLMYRKRLDENGTAPQIEARGRLLLDLQAKRPELADLVQERLGRNERFRALLNDAPGIERHLEATRALVRAMQAAVEESAFLDGDSYTLADCFATAALARFTVHGFAPWWAGSKLEDYFARMHERPSYGEADVVHTGTENDL